MPRTGRPTKYKGEESIRIVEEITDRMTFKDFFSTCGLEHLAAALGTHREILWEWRKKYRDLDNAVKKWESKRNSLFYGLSMRMQPGVWVFLAKNWLGMKDTQEHTIGGGSKPVKIRIVPASPRAPIVGRPAPANGVNGKDESGKNGRT